MSSRRFNWRLAVVLWVLGLPGIAAVTALALPQLLPPDPLPAPLPVLVAAAATQSAVLLALSVLVGTAAASSVHLRSPLIEAWLLREPIRWSRPLIAGAVGGSLGAVLLLSLPSFSPHALLTAQEKSALPIVVRLLYGGITEEILVRWGLMSGILWAFWNFFQRQQGVPRAAAVAGSVVLSAVIFGVAHLPAVSAIVGEIDAGIVVYIVTANAMFGLVAGYLFWKYGLESAIVGHLLAHAGAWAAR